MWACPGDDDWFSLWLAADEQLQVDARFSAEEGNVDISLFDPGGSLEAASSSVTHDEQPAATDSDPSTTARQLGRRR